MRTAIIIGVFFGITSIIALIAALLFSLIGAFEKTPMLTTLIEAEATIFGFFGLIAVYSLTSYDNRIDRLEEQKFEWIKEKDDTRATETQTRIDGIVKSKRKTINYALIIGIYLFLSLLLSILVLGIADAITSWIILFFSMALFFIGIVHFFFMFYDMATIPKETRPKPKA